MKKCKFWRTVRMVSVWIFVTMLLMSVPVMVSAAVLDPYEYSSNITVDGDNEIVYFSLPQEYIYWKMLADGELSAVGSGNVFTDSLEMAWLDNHEIDCYLFGADNYISTDGISVGSDFTFSFDYISSISGRTQTYDELRSVIVDLYDSGMNLIQSVSVWNDSSLDVQTNVVLKQSISGIVSGSVLSGCKYFRIRFHIDYNDVALETDTTVISLRLQNYYAAFSVPYSALYHLQQQGKLTNEKLTSIDDQLQSNGQTLDDILKQQQSNGNKLDDLISGGDGAQDLYEGSDKVQDAGDGLGDNIGQIHDFEDIYMGELEDNLDDIIAGADVSMLVAPLSFIHNYTNKIVSGVPSQYLVVFTLPMLFGIFMYIVGHPVRAPRPDTSGDIVTRETFTTSTIVGGPKDGHSRSTRTVTTSREIRRIHKE